MRQIGNYMVEDQPIGRGGMGQVLRGKSPAGVDVAIKEILPQFVADVQYHDRIEREIKTLMKFDNDNVVRIYDHFELNGMLYIVMELVEGKNIEEYVESRGPIPWKDALVYMERLLDTMAYIHEKNVIHRDIKPGNIMIRPDGRVCILDFGVAKDASSTPSTGGTVLGSIIGTDGYMSPEQAAGMSIDYRADIYALGCVLYYMITGKHAYEKLDSDFETQYAILNKPFPKISDKKRGVPAAVQDALDKAVDRNMMNRYQSCAEFRDRVARIARGGTEIGSRSVLRNISITVGREGCDILMDPNNYKVSRKHATITRKQFTGGIYYVYTDESSNGTLINNMVYTKGMSYNIQRGTYPEIYLAGDPACRLDVNDIMQRLDRMAEEAQREELQAGGTPPSRFDDKKEGSWDDPRSSRADFIRYGNPPMGTPDGEYTNADNIMDAVKICFKKYVGFKGRCGRGEFWWWYLFNVIVNTALTAIAIALEFKPEMFVVYGIWSLGTLLPSLAVTLRRLHDVGKSWGTLILCYVFSFAIVPAILLLVYLCREGEPMNNEYGPGAGQLPRRR